jgi:hypothetical protein
MEELGLENVFAVGEEVGLFDGWLLSCFVGDSEG